MTLESAIIHTEEVADRCAVTDGNRQCEDEHRQLAAWLRELQERRKAPEIVHCGECAYYDPPHVENNGVRYEYSDMPKDAFDIFGIWVTSNYGINVGGRCCRDYNVGYADDKRVYVPENNYCGRAERRTDK